MSRRLAMTVVAEIVGLTASNVERMARRIDRSNGTPMAYRGGLRKLIAMCGRRSRRAAHSAGKT